MKWGNKGNSNFEDHLAWIVNYKALRFDVAQSYFM